MATITFDLVNGIAREGALPFTRCVLREATAGDVIEANAEAEKVVLVPVAIDEGGRQISEPQLVISPTLVSLHRLRRQIVSIGDLQGPIEPETLYKLSSADLDLIQRKAAELDSAADNASRKVTQGGRGDEPGSGTA